MIDDVIERGGRRGDQDERMKALIEAHDWARSPLGHPSRWPQPLRTLVDLMLSANQPMFIAWGVERTLLYNDPYAEVLADKHPEALGRDFLEVWSEIRADLVPIVEQAYAGLPVHMDDIELVLMRKGFAEETHFSFSYTPVRDEAGKIAGFFCPCVEITDQVLSERRRAEDAARQKRLFEQAPGFITVLRGPEHVFEFANAAYRRLIGHREPVGRAVREVLPELEGQGFYERLDQVFATGERFAARRSPVKLVNPGGFPEERYLDFIYEPVTDETGQVSGIFVEGHDATDAERAEAELRAHVQRQTFRLSFEGSLRDLTDTGRIMTSAVTMLGQHLGANRVGYGQILQDDSTVRLSHCFTAGVEPLLGDFPLDGFGPDSIARQRRGETNVCTDVLDAPDQDPTVWSAIETRSFVSVPLVRDDRFRASLYVNTRLPRQWSAEDVALIEDVAARTWDAVDRARAEAALRVSEARFRSLADTVDEVFHVADPTQGRLVYVSPAYERIWGRSPEALYQDLNGFLKTIHPLDRQRVASARMRPLDQQHGEIFYRILRPDGTARWIRDRIFPIAATDGSPAQLVGVAEDVTDRTRADALRMLQNRVLELAIQDRPLSDVLGELVLAVEAQSESGVRASVLLLDPDGGRLRHGAAPSIPAAYNEAIDGIAIGPGVGSCGTAAHTRAPVHVTDIAADPLWADFNDLALTHDLRACWSNPILSGKGDLLGTFAMYYSEPRAPADADLELIEFVARSAALVIERKRAEESLRDLNETLESQVRERTAELNRVWEMSRDLFAIMGFDGYLKVINPAWEATLGCDAASLLAAPFAHQVHPDDHEAVIAAMERLTRGEPIERFEDRLRHADGSWRWIAWGLVPEGDVFYAVGRDITDEKQRQAELESAREQLSQSQKMEAMGQLTGGVAHDFNNLLTPIIGSLDMLVRKGVGSERERRLIDGALQSAERAKTLVQRLLAYARRQPLQPTTVDVARLVREMNGLIGSTLGPTIEVRVSLEDGLPPAKADPNQLEMALLNLAVNARDAMPEGGELAVSARRKSSTNGGPAGILPGEYVQLRVADTGAGMDEGTLARAIEPFFSTKGVGKGTGLGLSMVHGLAAQLGGGLSIRSALGKGTIIDLWLPISEGKAGPEEQTFKSPPVCVGRGTALLVDDEELVRMSTADMLTDLGFAVVEAASAEEALGLIENGTDADVLVTDHLMPGMSGAELARTARSLRPGLPVLVVSGYAEVEGVDPNLPRLTKPFRNAELAASLSALLPHLPG